MKPDLEIKDLHVKVEGKEILKGVNLEIRKGEIHALMGPNGSGKSTLAYALMGHPKYKVTKGKILLKGKDITKLSVDKRAKRGLFLAFQYPCEVPGVTIANFLRTALNAKTGKRVDVMEFRKMLKEKMGLLRMDESFADRYVNEGFSGGEKKKAEILQMAVLEPEIAILDETDSGLDIDAMRAVSEGINALREELDTGILIITHYQRILSYVRPDRVYIMLDGRIVRSGNEELVLELEQRGYESFRRCYGEILKNQPK
jgi:Fe-S cluster assembly ATP-binding protein